MTLAQTETLGYLPLVHRGKVRDTYAIDQGRLLVVTTDRISIFDFVLPTVVPMKGVLLNALSRYWFGLIEDLNIRTHLVAAGSDIDSHLPGALQGDPSLQARAIVVDRLTMDPVEFVARRYLTGSGLANYKEQGTVYGHHALGPFEDGNELPFTMDTPTTKSQDGHDEPLNFQTVRRKYPEECLRLLQLMEFAALRARQRGLILADSKLEFGRDAQGVLRVADEAFTPDSSRYWDYRAWLRSREQSPRTSPPALDKEQVRQWGRTLGLDKLNPESTEDLTSVASLDIPSSLATTLTQVYRYLFWRLTGQRIERYAKDVLGVVLPAEPRHIYIIFGSRSDYGRPYIQERLGLVGDWPTGERCLMPFTVKVHILSCHRNPEALRQFVEGYSNVDAVVAVGGKAFALPGVLDALFHAAGKDIPVVGVALGVSGTPEFEAAKLSISQLPGQPVVMDELIGEPYCNELGFGRAMDRVIAGELPPPRPRIEKPPEFDIWTI